MKNLNTSLWTTTIDNTIIVPCYKGLSGIVADDDIIVMP